MQHLTQFGEVRIGLLQGKDHAFDDKYPPFACFDFCTPKWAKIPIMDLIPGTSAYSSSDGYL